jgi:rubrerythrin
MAGLMEQPVEASPVGQEESPVRESCECGGEEEEFQYREAVLDDGEWVLRCPECGHLVALGGEPCPLGGAGAAEEAGAG